MVTVVYFVYKLFHFFFNSAFFNVCVPSSWKLFLILTNSVYYAIYFNIGAITNYSVAIFPVCLPVHLLTIHMVITIAYKCWPIVLGNGLIMRRLRSYCFKQYVRSWYDSVAFRFVLVMF